MSTFPSDGLLPTGSIDITFLEQASDIFTANNFNWNQGTTFDGNRTHADGTPKGSKVIKGFTEGTCDLQFPDASTSVPEINYTFTNGGLGYYITGRGRVYEAAGERKLSVNIRLCVNPLISYHADQALTQSSAMTAIEPTATGPETGLTYTWTADDLPTGVSINSSTGEISGTPTTVETTTAKIYASATNADGNTIKGVRHINFTVTAST